MIRRTVAWPASAMTLVSRFVGVPLGLVAGRGLWERFADILGIVPVRSVPWLVIAFLVPLALLLANLIAAVPARHSARTRPAVVLRSE